MGRPGDTREDFCKVFCFGARTHKYELRLFHVLPGAPALVLFPASFKHLLSPCPSISQPQTPGKGCFPLNSQNNLLKSFWKTQALCGTCQGRAFKSQGTQITLQLPEHEAVSTLQPCDPEEGGKIFLSRLQGYLTCSLEPPLVYVQEGAPGGRGISLQLIGEAS